MLFMIIPFAWVKGSNRVLKRFTAHQSALYRTWPGPSVRQRAYGRIGPDDEGHIAIAAPHRRLARALVTDRAGTGVIGEAATIRKSPRPCGGFFAPVDAAGKQGLCYVLACRPGLADPKRRAIPNTASACSTCTRRGSIVHLTWTANDPRRNQAPPPIVPWQHQVRIRSSPRCTRTS